MRDCNICQSITGYIFYIKSDAITQLSKQQLKITLSICKTEYIRQTQVIKEAV